MPPAKAAAAQSRGERPPDKRAGPGIALDFGFTATRRWTAECLSHEMKNSFQMVGLGEQVDHMPPLNFVSRLEQAAEVAGEGSRIARDVRYAGRSQRYQGVNHVFTQPTSRRIHHHQVRLQLATYILQILLRHATYCFHVPGRIVRQVRLRSR